MRWDTGPANTAQLEMIEVVFKISIHHDLSGLIHDAKLTASGMNVDTGIVAGMNVTVTHKRPSYINLVLMGLHPYGKPRGPFMQYHVSQALGKMV